MEKKKQRLALLGCAVLFAAACLLSFLLIRDDTVLWQQDGGSPVVLSEIMAANRTYPDPSGTHRDFIELRNLSAEPVALSGYMLSDSLDTIGYTFPEGTVLPGYGYCTVWCDKTDTTGQYAAFGISRSGETIYLYNSANVTVDEVTVPRLEANTAYIRTDASTWEHSSLATPGFENTEAGYQIWLAATGADQVQLVISEVMADNRSTVFGDGPVCDYVEIYNCGTQPAALSGVYLSDDPLQPLQWQLPDVTLAPGAYRVIPCGIDGGAPFGLSRSGGTVLLTGAVGNLLSQTEHPALAADQAWLLGEGGYAAGNQASPGFENTEDGYRQYLNSLGIQQMALTITEVMSANRSTLLSAEGQLCDWVELRNDGTETVALSQLFLTDDATNRGKFQLGGTLQPGQYALVPCVSENAGAGEAPFGLSRDPGSVLLCGAQGSVICEVSYPMLENDTAWALQADGSYAVSSHPSPGYENTEEGYLAFRAGQAPQGALTLSEAMAANDRYLMQPDGRCYDWVELYNRSDAAVNLADYCLASDPDSLTHCVLPEQTLEAGARICILLSGKETAPLGSIHVPFTLSSRGDWLYLADRNGHILDCLPVRDLPLGGSVGRETTDGTIYYYTQPTPGRENQDGATQIAPAAVLQTAAGIYDEAVSVEVLGSGTLHYTLDGSTPTADDPVLTQDLQLQDSAVVKVVNLQDGQLPSAVVSGSYLLNRSHSLPVVSIGVEPARLESLDRQAAYCSFELFLPETTITMDCAITQSGSDTAPKKSYTLDFQGRYGDPVLGYPLFGPEGPSLFSQLRLSAGGDVTQTMLREPLFSQLAAQMEVPYLSSRFCVVYLNGSYQGIYSLSEVPGATHYAQWAQVAAAGVTQQEDPAPLGSEFAQLIDFVNSADLSQDAAYEQLCRQLDVAAFTDWLILQLYGGNETPGKDLRFYRSAEDGGLWRPLLTDMDDALQGTAALVLEKNVPYDYGVLVQGLLENDSFRQQLTQRLEQLRQGVLSKEQVLSVLDALAAQLQPEMEENCRLWGGSAQQWQTHVQRLRDYISTADPFGWIYNQLSLGTSA